MLNSTIGQISINGVYTETEDNLDGLSTVLTTKTRNTVADVNVPLWALFGGEEPIVWLPTLAYNFNLVPTALILTLCLDFQQGIFPIKCLPPTV